jgi:hypothetical protein
MTSSLCGREPATTHRAYWTRNEESIAGRSVQTARLWMNFAAATLFIAGPNYFGVDNPFSGT